MEHFAVFRRICVRLVNSPLITANRQLVYLKKEIDSMKKYSVLFAALLALTAVAACQKKEAPKPAAAPAAEAPKADAAAPAAPAAPAPAAPAAPEKK
jgi:hypothetical protein